jgi:2-polyprenyl-6-hydroxyphenyl methylase/3-demethylubiquinone-9 3-methyltransferase
LGAEYVLRLLPRGTHDYAKFIRPSELLAVTRECGLETRTLTGLRYQPLRDQFSLHHDTAVNYMVACQKHA